MFNMFAPVMLDYQWFIMDWMMSFKMGNKINRNLDVLQYCHGTWVLTIPDES